MILFGERDPKVRWPDRKPVFSPSDRCDRCGALAHLRAWLRSGKMLQLCGHHGREHHAKLVEDGADIEVSE
jgi:hypothetical protein